MESNHRPFLSQKSRWVVYLEDEILKDFPQTLYLAQIYGILHRFLTVPAFHRQFILHELLMECESLNLSVDVTKRVRNPFSNELQRHIDSLTLFLHFLSTSPDLDREKFIKGKGNVSASLHGQTHSVDLPLVAMLLEIIELWHKDWTEFFGKDLKSHREDLESILSKIDLFPYGEKWQGVTRKPFVEVTQKISKHIDPCPGIKIEVVVYAKANGANLNSFCIFCTESNRVEVPFYLPGFTSEYDTNRQLLWIKLFDGSFYFPLDEIKIEGYCFSQSRPEAEIRISFSKCVYRKVIK